MCVKWMSTAMQDEKPDNVSQELRKLNVHEQIKAIAFEMCGALHEAGMSGEQIQLYISLCFTEMKKGKLTKSKEREIFDSVMKGTIPCLRSEKLPSIWSSLLHAHQGI